MSLHPLLPLELLEHILSLAWSSPLTTAERTTLMTSSPLVSRAWSSIFTYLSSRDAHIPSPAYLIRFLRLTRIESLYTRTRVPRERLCRSIHLTIANPHTHPTPAHCTCAYVPVPSSRAPIPSTTSCNSPSGCLATRAQSPPPPMASALSELVFTLSAYPGGFPALRTLSLTFIDMPFHDILAHHRFFRFPGQVTRLELRFTFSPHTPPWLVRGLRAGGERRMGLYPFVPSVKSLLVQGASEAFVVDMVRTCRSVEELELDFEPAARMRAEDVGGTGLLRLCEVGKGGEGEGGGPPMRLVVAGAWDEVWQGGKVHPDPASDMYRFRRH